MSLALLIPGIPLQYVASFRQQKMSRLRAKHSKQKEMGKNMDPGRAQLGKTMDQLEEYTSLMISCYFMNLD